MLRVTGKGSKTRVVPVLPIVREAVERYLALCPLDLGSDDPLFVGARGKQLSPRIIQLRIAGARAALGLPETATPHALRHSFATHLLGAGARPARDPGAARPCQPVDHPRLYRGRPRASAQGLRPAPIPAPDGYVTGRNRFRSTIKAPFSLSGDKGGRPHAAHCSTDQSVIILGHRSLRGRSHGPRENIAEEPKPQARSGASGATRARKRSSPRPSRNSPRNGYAATKLEDVAARARVSKGLPYLYFKTKEELFKAVVRASSPRISTRSASGWRRPSCRRGLPQGSVPLLHPGACRLQARLHRAAPDRRRHKHPELTAFYYEHVVSRGIETHDAADRSRHRARRVQADAFARLSAAAVRAGAHRHPLAPAVRAAPSPRYRRAAQDQYRAFDRRDQGAWRAPRNAVR